jgi:hypothetical protein
VATLGGVTQIEIILFKAYCLSVAPRLDLGNEQIAIFIGESYILCCLSLSSQNTQSYFPE